VVDIWPVIPRGPGHHGLAPVHLAHWMSERAE
jgi:hypothetical protein